MNIETFREYCLAKPSVTEETPFDLNTLCFKVMGKIFAIIDIEKFESINVKCDPKYALELREKYNGIIPGYHMNKNHWNTIFTNGSVSDSLIFELIDHSYNLVASKLTKTQKAILSKS